MDSEKDPPNAIGRPHSVEERREREVFSRWAWKDEARLDRLLNALKIPYDEAQEIKSVAWGRAWKRFETTTAELTHESVRRVVFSKVKWILKNRYERRKKAKERERVKVDIEDLQLPSRDDPHALAEAGETRAKIAVAFEALSPQQDVIMRLAATGVSLKEIAQLIGSEDSSVKEQKDRSRSKLRRLLQAVGIDVPAPRKQKQKKQENQNPSPENADD